MVSDGTHALAWNQRGLCMWPSFRITVEGGAKLGDVLLFLRDRGYTLAMYGSVPDLALVDALAVGKISSRRTDVMPVSGFFGIAPSPNSCS